MARHVKTLGAALSKTKKPIEAVAADGVKTVKAVVVDGLENVVSGLGTTHDKRFYSTWAAPRMLTRYELENMYRGSWLAKRIVNAIADDMTREWGHYLFDDPEDDTLPFAVEQAVKKLSIKSRINEVLKWARLYGGALVILGVDDVKRPEDMQKPLKIETRGKNCLKYLRVVDRWRAAPGDSGVTDLNDPDFGLPNEYIIAESSVRIHHSRVLRFNGQKLPYFSWMQNGMWDDSELQHVFDSLLNCDTSTQSVASMLFESNVDIIKSPQIANLLATKDGEAKVLKRFQVAAMMKSFNRTLLLDGAEEYEKKSNSFANLHDIINQFMVDVCGAAEIPMVRLFGQSAGGLNNTGDTDLTNYYDMIKSRQEDQLMPQLDRLHELVCRSVFGAVPKNFRFEFNSLWQMTEKEQAEIDKLRAERDQAYVNMGVIDEGLVARELNERGTYRTMTSEDVTAAEEMAEDLLERAKKMDEAGELNMPTKPTKPKKGDAL